MNTWSRFAGYLGVVLLLGGVMALALTPNARVPSESLKASRDALGTTAAVGYVLIIARLVILAFFAQRLRDRWLSFLALWLLIFGFFGYQGLMLMTMSAPGSA